MIVIRNMISFLFFSTNYKIMATLLIWHLNMWMWSLKSLDLYFYMFKFITLRIIYSPWATCRRGTLSIHIESHLCNHFWCSCIFFWFKPPGIRKQLLGTIVLVLWRCIMGTSCFIRWHCLHPEEKGSRGSWWR